jgi:hypothetical protein
MTQTESFSTFLQREGARIASLGRKGLRVVGEVRDYLSYRNQIRNFVSSTFHQKNPWGSLGSVQEGELALLQELCKECARYDGPLIEIGTLFGFTTTQLALYKKPAQKVVTVDNYSWNPLGLPPQAHFELTARVLEYLVRTGHVEQVRAGKDCFFAHYDQGPPALVFLDADHSYEETKKDIEWANRVGATIICGHDYCNLHPGVERAVDEAGGARTILGTLWVLKRQPGGIRLSESCAE